MKYRMQYWAALLAVTLFAAAPVHALDGDTIDRWIGAMYEFNEWAQHQPHASGTDDHEPAGDPADMDAMMAEVQRSMAEAARMDAEVQEIARRHGFADAREWSETSGRIFSAFYAVEMERAIPKMEREMEQSLREMENNPDIPEEHKANMRAMMEQQMEVMQQAIPDAPERDREAVAGRADELKAVFDAPDHAR